MSEEFDVERFVAISTDKAVRPSSVMGATKRVAEPHHSRHGTGWQNQLYYRAVRQMLGNGSVSRIFFSRSNGRPVTVTHPDVQRYFMLIPEAAELVLQAASLANPGAVYVLEMGEQVRLVIRALI